MDMKNMAGVQPELRGLFTENIGVASYGSAEEYGDGFQHVTKLTIPSFTQAVTNAALCFGKKLYDFPQGIIRFKKVFVHLTIAAPTCTVVGEIALGTVIGSGAAATTGGTATFENILDGTANTETSSTGAVTNIVANCEADNPDGTTTALDLYLNIAGTWTASENLTISGTITLFWDYLGDY